MALYIVCFECCEALELHCESDQIDEIHNFRGGDKSSASMAFGVTEVEEIVCSKLIVLEDELGYGRSNFNLP